MRILRSWQTWTPPLALALLAVGIVWHPSAWAVLLAMAAALGAAVLAAVEHAELVALRVGEPFGSLLLAVAVTVIEVGLIVMLMLGGGAEAAHLARDTVFAALMITSNGIVGLSLAINAGSRRTAVFRRISGESLASLVVLALLTLVVPNFTSAPGATLTHEQLLFVAIAALVTYGGYVLTLTHTHRDFFLPVDRRGELVDDDKDGHVDRPSRRRALIALCLLLASLVAVVGLAKVLSGAINAVVLASGLPASFVGVVIALLVLLPETIAATRAARRDRVQTALNLGYGSAMASIGLTIPTMAVLSPAMGLDLQLGLGPLQLGLLAGTIVLSVLTVAGGRATRHAGVLHLVVLAAYIFLAAKP